MSDIALTNAAAYAARYLVRLMERLGFGIHRTVHVAVHEGNMSAYGMRTRARCWDFTCLSSSEPTTT